MRYSTATGGSDELFQDRRNPFAYDPIYGPLTDQCDSPVLYTFLLLAYLDSAGYSERSERKSPYDQFHSILERYHFVAEKIQNVLGGFESEMGEASARQGDARQLPLEDDSIDGILFSPPYSFAIDYLENDSFHLNYLGVDLEALRAGMVGLRGKSVREKFELYQLDMDRVLAECVRVLRIGKFCTVVVGTNNNQLSRILNTPPDKVMGIDQMITAWAGNHGLRLVRKLSRQIRGMSNTMRTEFIVFLQKVV